MSSHTFKTKFRNQKKPLRQIVVPSSASLYKLAQAIVADYGFDFDHCFGFFSSLSKQYFDSEKKYELFTDLIEEGQDIEPTGAERVKRTKVKDVWKKPGDKMLFLFDYGDNLEWEVEYQKE